MSLTSQISILMVLYEENMSILSRTLDQLKEFKIIIIDNSGNKKLKDEILSKYQIHEYCLNKKNLGVSGGYNQALNLCDTEYVFMKNADCFIDKENLLILKRYLEDNQDCGVVSPTFYDENGKLSFNGGKLPENETSAEILNLAGNTCVEKVLGTGFFAKTEDIKRIGMYDENLFIFFCDDDLCRKVKKLNKHIVQMFDAKCIHSHGISKVKNRFKRIFLREHYFILDQLNYYKKLKNYKPYNKLRSKLLNYFVKTFINLFLLNFDKSLKFYSRIYAFIKFSR
tara:strand:+ start:2616 stop:3464 length:849 start_codon:yes stop_codon:yes gene_type:complete